MFWNAEYLKSVCRKSPDADLFGPADLIVLCETMCGEEDAASCLKHFYVEAVAANELGRGLALASKYAFITEKKCDSYISARIPALCMTIAGFYFPPNTAVPDIVLTVADCLATVNKDYATVLAGDFNCRIDSGRRGKDLCAAMNGFGFSLAPLPGKTYIGPKGDSTIDFIFVRSSTSKKITVDKVDIHHTHLRKHGQIITDLKLHTKHNTRLTRPLHIPRSLDMSSLQSCEALRLLRDNIDKGDLNTAVSNMEECIASSLKRNKQRYYRRWFDQQCVSKKKEVVRLYHRRNMSQAEREVFWTARRTYKKLCNEKKKKHDEDRLLRMLAEAEKRPWIAFGQRSVNRVAKVDLHDMSEHFKRLVDPFGHAPQLPDLADGNVTDQWYDLPFTPLEVENTILRSRNKKAVGPDLIANEHMKQTVDLLLPEWTKLFNFCLAKSSIPENWRESFLKILYKGKGDPNSPEAYRGISLLSCPLKTLTSLVNRRIIRNVENQFPDNQHGYRPGRSTRTPLKSLLERAARELTSGGLWVLFVDFSSAFPSVDRELLLHKLKEKFEINGRILRLIRTLLEGSSFRIDDGVSLSGRITEHIGVPQGDSLSPTLFLCYASDLSESLNEIDGSLNHALYADDLETDSTENDQIQVALDRISDWCEENKLKVNINKTKIMRLRRGGRIPRDTNFVYRGSSVEIVNEYEYLGVTLQSSLTFTKHIRKKSQMCRCHG